jgi:hypothetical protein
MDCAFSDWDGKNRKEAKIPQPGNAVMRKKQLVLIILTFIGFSYRAFGLDEDHPTEQKTQATVLAGAPSCEIFAYVQIRPNRRYHK